MDHELDVEQLICTSGMPRDLSVEFVDLFPIRVVASMSVDDRHLQPLGFPHGGVSVTLAESVATVGAWLKCTPGKMALASSFNASYPRPKRSGEGSWRSEYPTTLARRSRYGKSIFATRATSGCAWLDAP